MSSGRMDLPVESIAMVKEVSSPCMSRYISGRVVSSGSARLLSTVDTGSGAFSALSQLQMQRHRST